MKKVLIFSTAYFPFVGGAEVATQAVTDYFVRDLNDSSFGYEFYMITARLNTGLPAYERIGNVHVQRVGIGWPIFDKYYLALFGHLVVARKFKNIRFDIIWAIMASYGGLSALFYKLKHPSVPFLLTLQEGDDVGDITKRVGVFSPLFKKIFSNANYIQCISNFLANWARENGADCPVEVVPNGVDLIKFQNTKYKYQTDSLRKELGLKDIDRVVITTSRLVKKNGIGDLVDAIQYLPKDVKLIIIGSGELEAGLKKEISILKLDERVIMLGSIIPDDIPKYLAIADVFVRPSLSEGLGNSFLEAMAVGVPIIGTRVGGIPDFLFDPSDNPETATGLFCEVSNARSIAGKIQILLDDTALRNIVIPNGQKLISEKFSWQAIGGKMNDIFNKLTE